MSPDVLLAMVAACVTVTTAVISWLKFRDELRIKGVERGLLQYKHRVRELEDQVKLMEDRHALCSKQLEEMHKQFKLLLDEKQAVLTEVQALRRIVQLLDDNTRPRL